MSIKFIFSTLFFIFISINGQNLDSNKIYDAIFNEYPNKTLVVEKFSSKGIEEEFSELDINILRRQFPDLELSTLENFKNQNLKSKRFDVEDFSRKNIILVSVADTKAIFKDRKNGWKKFYKKYPNTQGLLSLSNVGFNLENTQALVYFGNQSDYLAGHGNLAFLRKVGLKWELIAKYELWIS